MKHVSDALSIIKQGSAQLLPEAELAKKLERGVPLKIKLGADPTSPDLHLGHAVVLSKLRQFQDLGHQVIFLIGDFTARLGDPTGRSKTRPPLTQQEIEHNMRTYFDQVSRILDMSKLTVRYNAEWLSPLSCSDIVQLCAKTTVARLIEREDFATRLKDKIAIGFHELLYPIFQGYDSVVLDADVEIGGTDQTFNVLMGRFLQEQYGKEPQIILTMPLLEGLDGVQKMSKSLGNAIALSDSADTAFGKLMSISDELMWRYALLLLSLLPQELADKKRAVADGSLHPMICKKEIAHAIVARFWSAVEAVAAQSSFEALFQKKDYSKAQEYVLPHDAPNPIWIVDLLKQLGVITASSQARRLIEDGAVIVDEEHITDFKAQVVWQSGTIVKAGKHRIYKIDKPHS